MRRRLPKERAIVPPLELPRVVVLAALAGWAVAMLVACAGYLAGGPSFGDDNPSHLAEILRVAESLGHGRTDFWFEQVNLGYPLFLAYQPLPALAMGSLVAATHSLVAPVTLFKLSLVALWATMPAAWYAGARWMGMRRGGALAFAASVLLLVDFRGFGLGPIASFRAGLYTQAWGTWLLPLAIGRMVRWMRRDGVGLGSVVALWAATLLAHLLFGIFVAIAAAMLVLEPGARRARALRLLAAAALVAVVAAFFLVPMLATGAYQGGMPAMNPRLAGAGVGEALRLLGSGELADHGRVPLLTALAALGAFATLRRARARQWWWLFGFTVAAFALFLGRATWGALYTRLPFHAEVEPYRYVAALQLAVAAWAALGVETIARAAVRRLRVERHARIAVACVALAAALFCLDRAHLVKRQARTWDDRSPAFAALVDRLASDRASRYAVFAARGPVSARYLNWLAERADRPQLVSYARGYHDTLSLAYLLGFDYSAASLRLYDVRAVVTEGDTPPSTALDEVWSGGGFRLFEAREPFGMFEPIRTPLLIFGDLKRARSLVSSLVPLLYPHGALPLLAPSEPPGAPAVVLRAGDAPSDALLSHLVHDLGDRPADARVIDESAARNRYQAEVEADAATRLLLKASYHPYWHARVDDRDVPILHVAPNLMAVDLTAGRHDVQFHYRNPPYQKALLLLPLLLLLALAAASVRDVLMRRAGGR